MPKERKLKENAEIADLSAILSSRMNPLFQKTPLQKTLTLLLILSLLIPNLALPLLPSLSIALAAESPWTQTDWSGGSGQTGWSDTVKVD